MWTQRKYKTGDRQGEAKAEIREPGAQEHKGQQPRDRGQVPGLGLRLQPLELGDNEFLWFKSRNLWCFVLTARGKDRAAQSPGWVGQDLPRPGAQAPASFHPLAAAEAPAFSRPP